jgi:Ca2+-binding EF-hand superfamily protein
MNTSDEQIRIAVDNIFEQYDTDKSGTLELSELVQVVRDIFISAGEKKHITEKDALKVMQVMDSNQDNKVSKS